MIARLLIGTPFVMIVPDNERFNTYTYEDEGYIVTAMPPGRSDLPIHADVPDRLEVNGVPAFPGNALRIDFRKESFDRAKGASIDPPAALIQRTVASLVSRLRYVTRGHQIIPLDFPQCSWEVRYVNDDESELEVDPNVVRAHFGRAWTWSFVGVNPVIWDGVHSLAPDWVPPRWDGILLDATAALPKVGTAIVLAATALEVFVADVLDQLPKDGVIPREMWHWLNHRGDWQKDPSTEDQFDVLLKCFAGHSLKEEPPLWEAFQNIRKARNRFVHEGAAVLGGKPVSHDDAARLIAKANDIIQCIWQWLPADLKWPRFSPTMEMKFEVRVP